MTLTNEQCIAVAEKVYKWQLRDWDADPSKKFWMEYSSNVGWSPVCIGEFFMEEDCLPEFLDSWQGFGRTMQKLASRNNGLTLGHIERINSASSSYLFMFITKEEYWGRVHLIALEIVNDRTES